MRRMRYAAFGVEMMLIIKFLLIVKLIRHVVAMKIKWSNLQKIKHLQNLNYVINHNIQHKKRLLLIITVDAK